MSNMPLGVTPANDGRAWQQPVILIASAMFALAAMAVAYIVSSKIAAGGFHTLFTNGGQFIGAAAGFVAIHCLSRSPSLKWMAMPVALGWGSVMAVYTFNLTQPPSLFDDFLNCYWLAGEAVWHGPKNLATAYNTDPLEFVNLPIVAYLFAPFGLMPPAVAGYAFLLIGIAVIALCWRMMVKLFSLDERESALLLFALMVSGVASYTLRQGNTTHFVLALLLAGMMFVRTKKDMAAGAVFALAALIKPALLLVGVYFFLRRRWTIVASGAAVTLLAVGLSMLIFGLDMHKLWLDTSILPFAEGAVPAWANQTLAGVIVRFDIGGPPGHSFLPAELSGLVKMFQLGLTGLLVAGVAIAIYRSGRIFKPAQGDIEIEFLAVIAFAVIASSLSWAHYYLWLMPAVVLAWTQTRPGAPLAKLRWAVITAFALLMPIAFVSWQMDLGRFGSLSNMFASHWLWGGLIVYGLLSAMRAERRRLRETQAAA